MGSLPVTLASLGPGLVVALALLLATFGVLAWRVSILLKLGTRAIGRRRVRAALIVFGLALSTTVIAGALGTGDTMGYSVRALVSQSLGPVDEVVALDASSGGLRDQARALVDGGLGGLSTAGLSLFDQARATTALAAARRSPSIAGATPAIVDQVSLVDPVRRETEPGVLLMAVPTPYPSGFGSLRTPGGAPVAFGSLPDGSVLLNAPAAQLLGAAPGSAVQVRSSETTWGVRVAAVVADSGLGGTQPTVIVPLASYQRAIGAAGQVNAVLVANRGGADSVLQSDAATQALRVALADPTAVRQLHAFLAQPIVRHALVGAESGMSPADRASVDALRVAAAQPRPTARFVSLVSDPAVRQELAVLAYTVPSATGRDAIFGMLRSVSALSVLPVKQSTLAQADRLGSVVTTVFLVLGIFSIAASALLVFLVFSLLGADRAAELATMRALGMTRRQIMGVFLFEGLSYDLAGAALGALAGVAAALLTTWLLGRSLTAYGFHLAPHVEPGSILVAFAAGALLTFAAMLAAAWRVSRAGIVAATRGSLVDERRDWLAVPGGLLVLAAGFVWHAWRVPPVPYEPRGPLVVPVALSLALLGLACWTLAVAGALSRRGSWQRERRVGLASDALTTLLIVGVAAIWVRALAVLPTPSGDIRADAVTVAVAGVVLIVTATAVIARTLGPLLGLLDRALASAARLRAVVRPAAGELARQRWRSGMAVVMFGMVVFTVVAGLTLVDALATAYGGTEPPVAGFQLQVDQSASQPITDMRATLASAKTISPAAFSTVGAVTPLDVQVVQEGVPASSWQGATLDAVDGGFLDGIRARVDRPAPGYDTASAWAALRRRPGTALVSA
ncbi:MAG TPA: FtsX-like permease family protein, partial [Thermomicrobiaceae bacterium]|nr:FtsX-like permease family protein [Thermomicrobiaceae bacterium]